MSADTGRVDGHPGVVFLASLVIALGVAYPGAAQDRFERQVRLQLEDVGQRLANRGYKLTAQVHTGELHDGRRDDVTVRLRGGVTYALVGVCDEDCDDLDLVLLDPEGRELAADVETDDLPVVEVTPDRPGMYTVRAVMASCKADPCTFGLGLFASSVDHFEQQVREQLDRAGERLRRDGYQLTHRIFTGELSQGQSEDVTVELDGGRTYVVLGVCDEDCGDLDLVLTNARGQEVDRDEKDDDYPAVAVTARRTERYSVRAVMADCAQGPCRYGFGVFAR